MDSECGQKVRLTIASALASAVLEWMLMFMLFVDASFSYLITRFAQHCRLQIPCLLCSRLDHVLGNERSGFYWDLICRNHKSKISSLVFCQLHNNLVDVHGTCESCFSSFAEVNKANAEAYRLLVGKLGAEPHYCLAGESHSSRKCACCNEQWISRSCAEKLFLSKSIDSEGADVDRPPKYDGDEVREITEGSSQIGQMQNKDADRLRHVKYTQIKVTSDTESEGPFSDNETAKAIIHETKISGGDLTAKDVYAEPQVIPFADCPNSEKLIHPDLPIVISVSESVEPTNCHINVESEVTLGHGLEELNWQQAHYNSDGTHHDESKENNATSTIEPEKEVHVGSDTILANEIQMDLKRNKTDSSSLDLGDAYRLAVGSRGRQLSGKLLEPKKSMTESTRASEDLMLLLSQISAARGIELSETSPRVSANSEDFKAIDAYGIIQRRISFDRNESNLSLDESTVSEIEGESVADRLKRQVEHDKKIMATLYKELEEERNASAIAANQAMAMITRLQEEKAALHMEALQCLRMMEEQAEYDSEALQKAHELLAEKEKQIQELEFQLELYRNQGESNVSVFSNADNDKMLNGEVKGLNL